MREETIRRGLEYTGDENISDDQTASDNECHDHPVEQSPHFNKNLEENTQDPDSDIHQIKEAYADSSLAFLRNIHSQGRTQQMTESEVVFAKKLLKDENHDYW